MNILPNSVVSVTYELFVNDSQAKGVFVEKADKDNPLTFLFGTGSMIPGFEKNLSGKKSGDTFNFQIAPEEAYGKFELEAIVNLPKEIFKTDGMIDKDLLTVGNIVPMTDNEGNRMHGKVMEVAETTVKMDFNHPLAGKELHFVGEIILVRLATPEELDHGHVHDGHHHH